MYTLLLYLMLCLLVSIYYIILIYLLKHMRLFAMSNIARALM